MMEPIINDPIDVTAKSGGLEPGLFEYIVLEEYKDWKVWLSEEKSGHYYHILQPETSIPPLYPSVTTCLSVIDKSQGLMRWAGQLAARYVADQVAKADTPPDRETLDQWVKGAMKASDEIKDKAAQAGTDAHGAVELALQGLPYREEFKPAVTAALQYLDAHHLSPFAAEVITFHPKLHSPGSVDLIAETPTGELVIVDWKRTRSLHKENRYQVAAYAGNVEALTGRDVVACYIFRLPQNDSPMDPTASENVITFTDWKPDWDVFKKSQALYYTLHLDRLKKMQLLGAV